MGGVAHEERMTAEIHSPLTGLIVAGFPFDFPGNALARSTQTLAGRMNLLPRRGVRSPLDQLEAARSAYPAPDRLTDPGQPTSAPPPRNLPPESVDSRTLRGR